jgi:hypothetical protein
MPPCVQRSQQRNYLVHTTGRAAHRHKEFFARQIVVQLQYLACAHSALLLVFIVALSSAQIQLGHSNDRDRRLLIFRRPQRSGVAC